MNPVKLKAYHKYKEKVYKVSTVDWLNNDCSLLKDNGEEFVKKFPFEDLVFLQPTRLHDKNGKEIYFEYHILSDGITKMIVHWDSWKLMDDIQNGVGDWEIIGNQFNDIVLLYNVENYLGR